MWNSWNKCADRLYCLEVELLIVLVQFLVYASIFFRKEFLVKVSVLCFNYVTCFVFGSIAIYLEMLYRYCSFSLWFKYFEHFTETKYAFYFFEILLPDLPYVFLSSTPFGVFWGCGFTRYIYLFIFQWYNMGRLQQKLCYQYVVTHYIQSSALYIQHGRKKYIKQRSRYLQLKVDRKAMNRN